MPGSLLDYQSCLGWRLAVLRSQATREITPEDIEAQALILPAGPIGSPVAAFVAPDAEEYAVALAEDELEALDEAQSELDFGDTNENNSNSQST